jgi:hypothetical protein
MNCWHDELDRSRTVEDVVRCARDYLALWAPQELAPLTLGWRELKVESASDIARVKAWLTETGQLRELATYFWHADARIGEIRSARVRFVNFGTKPGISASLQ